MEKLKKTSNTLVSLYVCNNNDETVFKTCIDIESRMQTALEYFVQTRVDLFKRKTLIEMAFHSKFKHFFQTTD